MEQKLTLRAAVTNIVILIMKFIGGMLAHSSALVADAAHSAADAVNDVAALFYIRMEKKGVNEQHDYGYGRYATMAYLLISVLLCAAAIWIGYHAVGEIIAWFEGEYMERPGWLALAVVVVAVLVKYLLYRYTRSEATDSDSEILAHNAQRYRNDVISSIGTAIAVGCAIMLSHKWVIIDSVAAFIIAVFLLITAYRIFHTAVDELLDKSLSEEMEEEIRKIVAQDKDIMAVTDVMTRRVGGRASLELVVEMEGTLSLNEVHRHVLALEEKLSEYLGQTSHMAVHVNPYD